MIAATQALFERMTSDPAAKLILRRFLIALVFLPAIWLGCLIYAYGVDTPYWDEWDEIPSELAKIHAGNLHLSDLLAQHNEHRIFFPRLLMLALARVTSWNVRAELFVIWLLACACSFNLWKLSRVTGWKNSNLGWALLAGANLLLFTPMAFENWLWGFQVGFLEPLACLTLAVWLVSASGPFLAFFYAIILSIVCTFSIASGFLCWFITLPLLLFPDGKLQWRNRVPGLACWFIGLVGSLALYLHGYVPSADQPSILQVAQKPDVAFAYITGYLGNPFTRLFDQNSAMFIGVVLVGFFLGAIWYLWNFRRESPFVARVLPWIMLSSFALMNAGITMIGRVGYGSGQALGPRYITFAVMLPIGLLFTWAAIYRHGRERVTPYQVKVMGRALTGCAVIGLGLNLFGSICVLDHWWAWRQARIASEILLEFIQATNEPQLMTDQHLTYGDYEALRHYSTTLSEQGYLRPASLKTGLISAIADVHAAPTVQNGVFDEVAQGQDGQFYALGWAVLPEKDGPADAILLTYDNSQGEPVIFELTFPGYARPDVAKTTNRENYESSGWIQHLPLDHLPPDSHILRAWAFDLAANRAYPLAGAIELRKKP